MDHLIDSNASTTITIPTSQVDSTTDGSIIASSNATLPDPIINYGYTQTTKQVHRNMSSMRQRQKYNHQPTRQNYDQRTSPNCSTRTFTSYPAYLTDSTTHCPSCGKNKL